MAFNQTISKILSFLTGSVVVVYMVGLTCAFPYYNYKYANEHGFLSWIFFGEIVPTFKSVVWPYYFIESLATKKVSNAWTAEERNSAINAYESINAYLRAATSFNNKNLNTQEASKISLDSLNSALISINKADSRLLSKVHKELPRRIEEEYKPILKETLNLLNSNLTENRKLAPDGLISKEFSWQQFLKTNQAQFVFPE